MRVEDLGKLDYRSAWTLQESAHAQVLAGDEERILLVEHSPVITFGRRDQGSQNLIASQEQLAALGVELVKSDRGGDITFHGPGQIVAYPIIRLNAHRFSVGGYVHALEDAAIRALSTLGISAGKDASAVGVWTQENGTLAKICAIGVRVSRGATLHGMALNVETDLRFFELIVPCGLAGKPVTSLRRLMGERTPPISVVRDSLARELVATLDR